MDKLEQLKKDLKAGKITLDAYKAAVKELLDDEEIDQEAYDKAVEYDPDNDTNDKPIYTQEDMDRVVVKKARQLVRKQLKDAGVDLEGVNNKELLPKVVEMVQAGATAGSNESELQAEVKQLRAKVSKLETSEGDVKRLSVENAVLKAAGKYNPVNPAQVVRALNADYRDLLDYDDESGALIPKSVDKALKRIKEAEPNLFQVTDGGGSDTDTDDFKGKTPGGAGQGNNTKGGKLAEQKKAALELMGYKQN